MELKTQINPRVLTLTAIAAGFAARAPMFQASVSWRDRVF